MSARPRHVAIADRSTACKAGVKGPAAADWLHGQGFVVPQACNTWSALRDGGLMGRLGQTEFFIEDGEFPAAASLPALLNEAPRGVYLVPRQDVCFTLEGHAIHNVLVQVCNVDFDGGQAPNALFMTSMVGVPVLAIVEHSVATAVIRIWADPTFGPYLWKTLSNIVDEIDGDFR